MFSKVLFAAASVADAAYPPSAITMKLSDLQEAGNFFCEHVYSDGGGATHANVKTYMGNTTITKDAALGCATKTADGITDLATAKAAATVICTDIAQMVARMTEGSTTAVADNAKLEAACDKLGTKTQWGTVFPADGNELKADPAADKAMPSLPLAPGLTKKGIVWGMCNWNGGNNKCEHNIAKVDGSTPATLIEQQAKAADAPAPSPTQASSATRMGAVAVVAAALAIAA